MGSLSLEEGCRHVGFNGRWNKKADTCYCWWVAGTLAASPHLHGPESLVCKLTCPRCWEPPSQSASHLQGGTCLRSPSIASGVSPRSGERRRTFTTPIWAWLHWRPWATGISRILTWGCVVVRIRRARLSVPGRGCSSLCGGMRKMAGQRTGSGLAAEAVRQSKVSSHIRELASILGPFMTMKPAQLCRPVGGREVGVVASFWSTTRGGAGWFANKKAEFQPAEVRHDFVRPTTNT